MIKPQNIFVFHHTCLALTLASVAVGLFLPTEGEHFGPSPGVGDAWPTAIQIHWCNCFLYCVFFFFFSCPCTHWQQPVRSDAGRTCSNWTNQWLCVFACMCVLTSMSLQFPSVRCLHCFCSFQSTKSTCCGVT